jgi:lysophospholipase L1-like esterase
MWMRIYKAVALNLLPAALTFSATAQSANANGHWVSAWSTAVHTPRSAPGAPPQVGFENQTIRMVVRMTLAGDQLRVRLSNEFGTTPLVIGVAHIAAVSENGTIVPDTDHQIKFGGATSISIPAGAPMLSDPVDIKFPAFGEVAISIFLPKQTAPSTFHLLGQHDTYISEAGDFTSAPAIANPKITKSWYFIGGIDIWAPSQAGAIVTFGDSITDGFGAKSQYGDWPNQLAARLAETRGAASLAVDNEGIGGNRILHDGAGVAALTRFDRDVLSQPGVKDLILLEGINDIGWPDIKPRKAPDGSVRESPFSQERVSSDDLIRGMKQMIDRAHEHGIRVFGATMTPYEGANVFTPEGEATRQAVNQWIRGGGAFDGVFDFDAAVRDPAHQSKFRDDFQTGDYLHPNAAGYKAMAGIIDLKLLETGTKH